MKRKAAAREEQLFFEIRLETWEQFLKAITDSPYSNWAFRGQCDERWHLESALSRYFRSFSIDPAAWLEQENRIVRIFKRKAHQFLSQPPDLEDDFQWMALMQHHGAPTRLLDFTWSPYVAAFFALVQSVGDAAVWALNPARISPRGDPRTGARMDPRKRGNLNRYFLKGKSPFIWVGEPHTMNQRLIAQSGTFALPSIVDRPMEDILQGYRDPNDIMAKFILPSQRVRETGLRELYRMNITYATLFPDLDGLARSLGYELEFHWAYNPRSMKLYGHL